MKVWILVKGEISEGGNIIGVYKNEEKARNEYNKRVDELALCDFLNIEEWEVCE